MKTSIGCKFLTLSILAAALLSSTGAIAASLERAGDINSFIYGQRGMGIQMDANSATDFGHITDDPWSDMNGSLQQYTSRSIQVFESTNQYVTLGATHGLSISPQDPSRQTYFVDMTASIHAGGYFGDHGAQVVIGDNALRGSAYADAGFNQTFRILAGPGESAGDPVTINVNFDVSIFNNTSVGTGSAWLSSQYPGPFGITLNNTLKWQQTSNFDAPGFYNVVDLSFAAVIGDTVGIGYMVGYDAFGPAVFANYAMNKAFVQGEGFEGSLGIQVMGDVSVNAVPEPGTWALLLGGLGLVWQRVQRRPRR